MVRKRNEYVPYQLDPEFYDRLRLMQRRIPGLDIMSGYRTPDQQDSIRERAASRGYNPDDWAAPGGQSSHNFGLGADLEGDLKSAKQKAPLYGLYFPLKEDPWHVEPLSVTENGLPWVPQPAPTVFDFLDTTPTGDKGLDANLANQATARAASKQGLVPPNVPPDMLAPDIRSTSAASPTPSPVADNVLPTQASSLGAHAKGEQPAEAAQAGMAAPKATPSTSPQAGEVSQTPTLGGTQGLEATASGQATAPDEATQLAETALGQKTPTTPIPSAPTAQPKGAEKPPPITGAPTPSVNFASGKSGQQLASEKQKLVAQPDIVVPGTPGTGSGGAGIVAAAMTHIGKPYSTSGRFGPNAYDCSGLVVAALRENGIDPGGNTVSTSLQQWGTPLDLETAYNTPGAMLFVWGSGSAGHVEISRGDGTTIGSSRGGVQVRQARGRGWTGAALPPGVAGGTPGTPGATIPVSPVPQRVSAEEARKDPQYIISSMNDMMAPRTTAGGMQLSIPQPMGLTAAQATPSPLAPEANSTIGAPAQQITPSPATGQPAQAPPVTAQQQSPEELMKFQAEFQKAHPGAPAPLPAPAASGVTGALTDPTTGATSQPGQPQGQGAAPIVVPGTAGPGQKAVAGARGIWTGQEVVNEPPPEAVGVPGAEAQGAGQGFSNDLDGWVRQAVQITGVGSEWIEGLKVKAMQESGGRPDATNNWDSNAKRGTPSIGLMQTIQPTFNAYKISGYDDIRNPVHNLIAAIRYIQARYGGDINKVAYRMRGY